MPKVAELEVIDGAVWARVEMDLDGSTDGFKACLSG